MNKLMQKKHLKKLTGNLGKVEITDDKIICYVDKNKLKNFKCKDIYNFVLMQKLFYKPLKQQKYDLEKPIYYIFENICFDDVGLRIESCGDVHFIFKNCSIHRKMDILYADSITLDNNTYWESRYYESKPDINALHYFKGKINNLKIINDRFCLSCQWPFISCCDLKVENLEMKNSEVDLLDSEGFFKIEANNIDIIESSIEVNDTIALKANNINIINSKIESKNEIRIINEKGKNNNNLLTGLIAPKIIYNGIDLDEIDKNTNSIGIESLRSIFINQLKLIKENVLKEKVDKLSILEDKLNNESIKNVLK